MRTIAPLYDLVNRGQPGQPVVLSVIPIGPWPLSMDLALRTSGTPPADAIRSTVQEVAPGARVSLSPFRPFERTLGQPRVLAALLGARS